MIIALLMNVALMYAILVGVNLPAPLLGIDFQDDASRQRLWFEPPGYVIPLAWFVLFTLLGIARYQLAEVDEGGVEQWWLIALSVVCASYAYYTLGLAKLTGISALWYGLIGNLVVIVLALIVAYVVGARSTTAGVLVLPVAVWTTYATAIVLGEMKVQRLI